MGIITKAVLRAHAEEVTRDFFLRAEREGSFSFLSGDAGKQLMMNIFNNAFHNRACHVNLARGNRAFNVWFAHVIATLEKP